MRILSYSMLIASLLALVFATGLLLSEKPSLYGHTSFSQVVEDRDGHVLRMTLAQDERYRLPAELDAINPHAINATLLYEDRRFWSHPGVDLPALFRAAWTTYVKQQRMVGASTISMQLARLRFNLSTRSVSGKLQQITRALQLERHYTKQELLEAYLNLAPYGGNIEGINTASRVYFHKPASDLSLPESLALAVIAQNPQKRNPVTQSGYTEMNKARQRLRDEWETQFGLSDESKTHFELRLNIHDTTELPYLAPHFVNHLLQANAEPKQIHSTLDLRLQTKLEATLQSYTARNQYQGINNASALLIDYRSMEVLASVGSADFNDDAIAGQVDGTNSKRSPGSTLKPFVYAMAIDEGIIHPNSMLKDAPQRFSAYTPENFDRQFMGPVTAEDALIYSRNVPATDLLSKVGYEHFHNFLNKANVQSLKEAEHYGLAMILGGNELTMRELVTLYAMLNNHGEWQTLVEQQDTPKANTKSRLLSAEASFLTLDMLRKAKRPGALHALDTGQDLPVAWKTGTSYAYRDAWTVGSFGPYVLAVWVGNFDGSANAAFVGRSAAAPLFFSIADTLTTDALHAATSIEPPPALNLRRIATCASTGDLPGKFCPQTKDSWFIPGVSPLKASTVYREIRINPANGLRSCDWSDQQTERKVFEFWPSDLSKVFEQAGIILKKPPAWSPECLASQKEHPGLAPRITSPTSNVDYLIRRSHSQGQSIPLSATTDADANHLYWFSEGQYLGQSKKQETLDWYPKRPGSHVIVAVDDLGRRQSQRVNISLTE